jgi:hypothetical protein
LHFFVYCSLSNTFKCVNTIKQLGEANDALLLFVTLLCIPDYACPFKKLLNAVPGTYFMILKHLRTLLRNKTRITHVGKEAVIEMWMAKSHCALVILSKTPKLFVTTNGSLWLMFTILVGMLKQTATISLMLLMSYDPLWLCKNTRLLFLFQKPYICFHNVCHLQWCKGHVGSQNWTLKRIWLCFIP